MGGRRLDRRPARAIGTAARGGLALRKINKLVLSGLSRNLLRVRDNRVMDVGQEEVRAQATKGADDGVEDVLERLRCAVETPPHNVTADVDEHRPRTQVEAHHPGGVADTSQKRPRHQGGWDQWHQGSRVGVGDSQEGGVVVVHRLCVLNEIMGVK